MRVIVLEIKEVTMPTALHRAPVPVPADEPFEEEFPGELPVPQDEPVPDHHPEEFTAP